ncbi:MAG: alpha/beta hydrolase, partial [Alphaproteobacteria bacterium]|nr:alpha/beta hydrolase [Alphaproteobacteria bacterium]
QETVTAAEKNLKFFQEIVKTDIIKPKPEWASPNKILFDLHTFTLRDFSTAPDANEIPTLVLPPYAGHTSVIADFHAGQSLIATLMQNGLTRVYATDWRSADQTMKDYDIDNYLAELHVAVGELGGRVKLIGLCQGGWMAALYAARFPAQVAALVCAGTPLDTQAGNGGIRLLADDLPMSFYENLVLAGGGLLKGEFMLEGFKSLNPEKNTVDKYVSLYEHIDDAAYLKRTEAFESWYENTINLPGRWYLQAVKELFKENRFAKGRFKALGITVKPQTITCPTYLLGGREDDITPAEQVFNAKNFIGTPKDDIVTDMAEGGHIGLFMGSRALTANWPKIAAWLQQRK